VRSELLGEVGGTQREENRVMMMKDVAGIERVESVMTEHPRNDCFFLDESLDFCDLF